jgi:hypothetical protein
MPVFRFVFHEDVVREDVEGIELADYERAVAEAKQAAKGTLVDGVLDGLDPPLGSFAYIMRRASWWEPYFLRIY